MEVPMAKLLSGKEVTASLNEEIRKKTEQEPIFFG